MKIYLFLLVCIVTAFSFTNCLPRADANKKSEVTPAEVATISPDGKYTGVLTYMAASGKMVTNVTGTARISKNKNNKYDITFSDGVPSLKGLAFKNKNGTYATVASEDSVTGIVIEDDELTIGVLNDGNSWAFTGEK